MINPNYVYSCKCLSVYDGDTATFDIDLGFNFKVQNQHFRFYGINAPEMKAKTKKGKLAAIKSRDYVSAAILGTDVSVQFFKNPSTDAEKQEKYGRYLAVIYYTNAAGVQINLNDELVALGLAVPYMIDQTMPAKLASFIKRQAARIRGKK
jgi:endonuclease YncB( thermonuclease family)